MSFQEKIDNLSLALKSRNIGLILKTAMAEFGVDLQKMETLSNLSDTEALAFIQTLSPMLDFKVHNRSVLNTCSMLGYSQCVEYIIPRTNEDGIAEAQAFALAFDQNETFQRLWKEKANLEFDDQMVIKKLLDKGMTQEFFQGLNTVEIQPKKLAAYFHRAMMSNRVEIYEALYSALTKIGVEDFNPLTGAARFDRLNVFEKYIQPRYITSEVLHVVQNKTAFLDAAYPHLTAAQKITMLPSMVKNKWEERVDEVLNNIIPAYHTPANQAPEVNIQSVLQLSFNQALKSRNPALAIKILPQIKNTKNVANGAFEHAARKTDQELMDVLFPHTTQAGRNSALVKLAVENNSKAIELLIDHVNLNQVERQLYHNLQLQYKDVEGLLSHSNFNESIATVFSKIQRNTLQKNVKNQPTVESKQKLI